MRTTLTLDPDVVRLLREETHRLRKPFKQVVNEARRWWEDLMNGPRHLEIAFGLLREVGAAGNLTTD